MAAAVHCRSAVLAEMLALADGAVLTEPVPCDELARYVVVTRRDGLELAAELCTPHTRLAELDPSHVRVIAKHVRT